jgi:cytochrome b
MQHSDRNVLVWDWPLRAFHWLLVITIAIAFLSSEEDSALNQWHVLSGWVAGLLLVFRLVWGFAGGEHSRFSNFIRPSAIARHISELRMARVHPSLGHNPLGALAVVVLLGLIAVTVWTGAFGGQGGEDLHEIVAWTLLAAVAIHVIAVIAMSLLQRENLVRAMVTGRKAGEQHPHAVDAKSPTAVGIMLTAGVLAAAIYGVLRYDPEAFSLRTSEAYEHRSQAQEAGIPAQTGESDEHGE